MNDLRINSALISVFSKLGIEPIVEELSKNDVKIINIEIEILIIAKF